MDFSIIFNYELKSLAKNSKSTVISLIFVSVLWGIFLSFNLLNYNQGMVSMIWIILFAFVASSGFANASFARERLSGSWEILLASGVSRTDILHAKLLFSQTASFICGVLTFATAFLLTYIIWDFIPYIELIPSLLLFICATLSINIFTAYFTIININQRSAHLINMGIMSACSTVAYFFPQAAALIMLIPAVPFLYLCKNSLYKDKTILPIVY